MASVLSNTLIVVVFYVASLVSMTTTDVLAQLEEGIAAYERGDYETAFREFLPLAEEGDAAVQHLVAKSYSTGIGVRANQSEALYWMRRSAEQNWPPAQFDLGVLYADGRAVTRDLAAARSWYVRAAEHGQPEIQLRLGMMYFEGIDSAGASRDDEQAVKWFRRAAEEEFPPAQFLYAVMLEEGRGIARNVTMAMQLYELAAEQGVAEAQGSLGDLYYSGRYVPRNCSKAAAWFREAAQRNLNYAQFMLARMFDTGECLPKDDVQAYLWYSNAWHSACSRDRPVLDFRVALERRMSNSAVRVANALWREWTPIGTPSLGIRDIQRQPDFYYPFPRVKLPRPHCGWLEQFG